MIQSNNIGSIKVKELIEIADKVKYYRDIQVPTISPELLNSIKMIQDIQNKFSLEISTSSLCEY